ncbi:hypothetical protein GCM10023238_28860 [Streptomyces heliomycini]
MTATSVVAAADVHHHVAGGLWTGSPEPMAAAMGSSMMCTGWAAGLGRRLDDGAALDAGDAEGTQTTDPRTSQVPPLVDLQDEVAEHPLGDLEVGD